MAVTRTVVLAQGTTAADSSVITVDAGAVITIGLFVATGSIPYGQCQLYIKTPGADLVYADGDLDHNKKSGVYLEQGRSVIQVAGPAEVFVRRPADVDVGVFTAA